MLLSRHKRATASSLIVKAAAVIAAYLCRHRAMARRHNRLGKSPCHCIRHTFEEIYNCLGPIYFRRAYRISYESFWHLHDKVAPKIDEYIPKYYKYTRKGGREGGNYIPPPTPNGCITTSVWLALALRYFAGGAPTDQMCKYGVSHASVFVSVWVAVEAIKNVEEFGIKYPSSHEDQLPIAYAFQQKSKVQFNNCVGAIDGILIWMHKPSEKEAKRSKVDQKKYLCGRKHKFGLNCQAVCDVRGRFLDMSIIYGGLSSDCLAFEDSNLYKRLEQGLLWSGCVIFGDNAYLNTSYMATPYPNVAGKEGNLEKSKDNYNFYNSQL
jgi:hypothetical protein